MGSLKLKVKLYFLCFIPMTLVFLANAVSLIKADALLLMLANLAFFISVITIAWYYIESYSNRLNCTLMQLHREIETVSFSSHLLKSEIKKSCMGPEDNLQELIDKAEILDVIYKDLKKILVRSLKHAEGKEHIAIAKELGNLCAETRHMTLELSKVPGKAYEGEDILMNIADNIIIKTTEMRGHLSDLGPREKEVIARKPGSLRRAIKYTEKRAYLIPT